MFPTLRSFLALAALMLVAIAHPASAHPSPFSDIDLTLEEASIEGRLTVHTIDLAHELGIDQPQTLLDQGVLDSQYSKINDILLRRISLGAEGVSGIPLIPGAISAKVGEDAVELYFTAQGPPPAALKVSARLFPYDPAHQTFVNIYEDDALVQQFLFGNDSKPGTHFAGGAAGIAAVFATFIPSGAHHVLIGPDHILFLIGLILLGGSLRRLALIVTAFTLGHSVTLALAALNILVPPAWLIEPLIALSIVIVGLDNLMRGKGRDLRPVFALLFGLVHGFGFAFVLREFGLPDTALAASLLAFNIGVELGQLAIVVPVALVLAWIRPRWPIVANRIVWAGSLAVILAGAYWFVDRVLAMGSG